MVYRRRPAIHGLILLALSLPTAALELEVVSEGDHLRFPVPEPLYAAGLRNDVSDLLILDAQGREVEFAACTVFTAAEDRGRAPLLGVPEIGRAEMATDGSLTVTTPPGAPRNGPVRTLIVDLRGHDAPVRALAGLPPVRQVRDSPSLRQWGPPLPFHQADGRLLFDPRRLHFLQLELTEPVDTVPGDVEVVLSQVAERPQPHWFSPEPLGEGRFRNTRRLPIFAARLSGSGPADGWSLTSRQADWDAWKPRGQVGAGAAEARLRFSAVTDPLWRNQPANAGPLELAHATHELRIPDIAGRGPLRLRLLEASRRRPTLSCRATERMVGAAPVRVRILGDGGAPRAETPRNLRSRFLLIAGVLILAGAVGRVWWRRRRR